MLGRYGDKENGMTREEKRRREVASKKCGYDGWKFESGGEGSTEGSAEGKK